MSRTKALGCIWTPKERAALPTTVTQAVEHQAYSKINGSPEKGWVGSPGSSSLGAAGWAPAPGSLDSQVTHPVRAVSLWW